MQFAAKICLLTSFRETCFIEIVPQHQVPVRGISSRKAEYMNHVSHCLAWELSSCLTLTGSFIICLFSNINC